MESAFDLFPRGVPQHSDTWKHASKANIQAGFDQTCPGKDPVDTKCTCPDLVYATRVNLRTGITLHSYIYCGCCDLPVTKP